MPVEHLPPTTNAERIVEILRRDGCVIVDRLAEPTLMDRILHEMKPHLDATAAGPDGFTGRSTRRTGGLVARSKAARDVIAHGLVLDAVKGLLEGATSYQLHLTQIIAIGPGESEQAIHRDQWAFDFFRFPAGFEVQCNTIWAMTDFCDQNGATRVIPGSNHAGDREQYTLADTEPAEMEKGSALFYTGSVYHGGGPNRSDGVRCGLNVTYARGWLRQEENQYLTVPLDVARELSDPLLRLIGYARGAYALGYVDDLRDPLEVVRGAGSGEGFGDLSAAAERARASDESA